MRRYLIHVSLILLVGIGLAWILLERSGGVSTHRSMQSDATELVGNGEGLESPDLGRSEAPIDFHEPSALSSTAVIRCLREDGLLLPGVRVRIYDGTSGEILLDGQADASASIEIIGPSRASVVILGSGWADQTNYSGVLNAQIPNGASQHELVLESNRCSLSVLVLAEGRPIPHLPVSGSDGTRGHKQITNLAGVAVFRDIIPGFMSVAVGPPQSLYARELVATKEEDANLLVVHIGVGSVRVQLTSDMKESIQLEGFTVSMQPIPNDASSIDRQAQTDVDGCATFDNVLAGDYLISIGFRRPLPERASALGLSAAFAHISVALGTEMIDLNLVQSATIRVRVIGGKRNYSVPAKLMFRLPNIGLVNNWRHSSHYLTVEDFEEFKVPPGELTLIAMNERDGWGEHRLYLLPGETQECTIALSKIGPSLTVEVFGPGAEGIDSLFIFESSGGLVLRMANHVSDATVSVRDDTTLNSPPPIGQAKQTLKPGYSKIVPALPDGEYRIICTSGNRRVAEGNVTLVQNSVVTLFAGGQ